MKKSILYIAVAAALGMSLASCEDFLDRNDTNSDYVSVGFFSSDKAIYDGMIGVYNQMYMNNLSGLYLVPAVVAFDHWTPMLLERNQNLTIGAGGTLTPDNENVTIIWANCYRGIARANEIIFGAQSYLPTLNTKALQYLAEVHALRAYYYYILIGLYGDVPFFMAPVTTAEYDSAVRTSRAKIADDIIADLKSVAEDLPWAAPEAGRVNRGFLYGMIARYGLLAGGLDYDGRANEYYKAAADAAKEVITNGGYQLASDYGDLFNVTGQLKADVKSEIFYALPYTGTASTKITNNIAFGQTSRIQGQTSRHISMMFADTYECTDGLRIDESPLYDNSHPQKNRDPRFAVNFWMDGDMATVNNGAITTQEISCYKDYVDYYSSATGQWEKRLNIDKAGASASWASFVNSGVGYMNAKYCHETAENISAATVDLLVMRYAEVLLSYAEAKIELGDLDQSVYDAIDMVRKRAGMPKVSDNRKGNQSKMRQLVRRERKVELMTEGLHIFDMRRWKTGDIENKYPSYGAPTIEYQYQAGNEYVVDGVTYYSLGLAATDIPTFKPGREDENDIPCYDAYKEKLTVRDLNRIWDARFELWPIPQEERNRAKNITQNEGYPMN